MVIESRSIRIKTGTILSKNDLFSLAKIAIENIPNNLCTITIESKHNLTLENSSLDELEDALSQQNRIEEFKFYIRDVETTIHLKINRNEMFNSINIESFDQDKVKVIYVKYNELIELFKRRSFFLRRPFYNIMYSFIFFVSALYTKSLSFKVISVITIIMFAISFPTMHILFPEIDTRENNKKRNTRLLWILNTIIMPFVFIFIGLYIAFCIQKYLQ